jgi:DNA-binding NarL/FixJ family response regulator
VLDTTLAVPVLVVEDDLIVQLRLKNILLGLGYPAETLLFAANLAQAQKNLAAHSIALALVDLGLADGNGLDFIQNMRLAQPNSLILVISAWSTQTAILNAIQAGATGYVLKERDDLEVSLAITSVLRGGAPIDPFIAGNILKIILKLSVHSSSTALSSPLLSNRELQILQLIAQGLSNKEIADQLYLSRYTVECHVKHIYRKLSVSNRAKAINTARTIGLLH